MLMKVDGVIQYKLKIPYLNDSFSFKIYQTQLYLLSFVRQMPQVISYLTYLPSYLTYLPLKKILHLQHLFYENLHFLLILHLVIQ